MVIITLTEVIMDLIQFLRANEDARKIFGKRELKIIEKQINGINLTQSEKNRLSRDIRKKFLFIKEVSKFSDEFDLKKGLSIKRLIKGAKETILRHHLIRKIKKIILFGSVIENKLTFKSDIDIAVAFDEITEKQAFEFRKNIMGKLPDKIDIQVFNFLPKKIKEEIKNKGRIIYKNE
ncbi:nucleotidyltransferase domain-containing protein [Candidatus Pacearchaeota archaeon]|nr:nucleotidyltransferase domain-containing protein [Candidatus Pacearchaeota archaeon]